MQNKIVLVFAMLLMLACGLPITVVMPGEQLPNTATTYATATSVLQDVVATYVATAVSLEYHAAYVEEFSGGVDEAGGVHPGEIYPGDNAADNGDWEGFITFNIEDLPDNVLVTSALMYFEYDWNGFPFAQPPLGLGNLNIELLDYYDLDESDYEGKDGVSLMTLTEHPKGPIDLMKAVRLKQGTKFVQLRLYFYGSNFDNYRDDVMISSPELTITYLEAGTDD